MSFFFLRYPHSFPHVPDSESCCVDWVSEAPLKCFHRTGTTPAGPAAMSEKRLAVQTVSAWHILVPGLLSSPRRSRSILLTMSNIWQVVEKNYIYFLSICWRNPNLFFLSRSLSTSYWHQTQSCHLIMLLWLSDSARFCFLRWYDEMIRCCCESVGGLRGGITNEMGAKSSLCQANDVCGDRACAPIFPSRFCSAGHSRGKNRRQNKWPSIWNSSRRRRIKMVIKIVCFF